MTLSFAPDRLRRHDLVHINQFHWSRIVARQADLVDDPDVACWVKNGRPLVARRGCRDTRTTIALGLPLPPSAGKRRLAFDVPVGSVIRSRLPLTLEEAGAAAPPGWSTTIGRLQHLVDDSGSVIRVFGSLAWAALTMLDYLTPTSDLDFLLPLPRQDEVPALTAGLMTMQEAAPMQLDGELVRSDGVAANWREVHARVPELLVKSLGGVLMMPLAAFLDGE